MPLFLSITRIYSRQNLKLSWQLLIQLLSASEFLCSHDFLWIFFVHAIILHSLLRTCTWFTFNIHFALKLPNMNSMNIKCFSASHPSAPLVCQGTLVAIINTNMSCYYDKQQQLKEHQAVQRRRGHLCFVSFGALQASRWCPHGWAWGPRYQLGTVWCDSLPHWAH